MRWICGVVGALSHVSAIVAPHLPDGVPSSPPRGPLPLSEGQPRGTRPSRCPPREPVACSLPAVVAGSGCRCYHTEHFPAAATYSLQRARPRSLKERKCDGWEVVMDTTVGPEVFNDGGTSDDTDIKSVGGGDAQPKWNA